MANHEVIQPSDSEEPNTHLRLTKMEFDRQGAQEIIAAHERDRRDERAHRKSTETKSFIVILSLIFSVMGFSTYALSTGEKEIITDAMKVLSGGLAGYGIGRLRKQAAENVANSSSDYGPCRILVGCS